MDWITGIQNALNYIEDHITQELDSEEIAKQSFSSSFHFQRVFSILCGYTLGEYIRNRRLTLAGAELAAGTAKVIDVAFKYGYDSPDSFARAFQKFHGITPSQARGNGAMLRAFSRLFVKVSLEGGSVMDYKIEKKKELVLLGYKGHFEGAPYGEARFDQEGSFWVSTRAKQWMLKGITADKLSDYCVLANMDDHGYDFYLAVTADQYELENLYNREVTGIDFMEQFSFEILRIPAGTYAVFETARQKMPIPEYIQLRRRIVTEWLPGSGYQLADGAEIAVYHWGITRGDPNRSIEIWMPVEKQNDQENH